MTHGHENGYAFTEDQRAATCATRLIWKSDRWHCDGRPIHAGMGMECRFPDGAWLPVRIETEDHGRMLLAYFDYHGMELRIRVHLANDGLRWPRAG